MSVNEQELKAIIEKMNSVEKEIGKAIIGIKRYLTEPAKSLQAAFMRSFHRKNSSEVAEWEL